MLLDLFGRYNATTAGTAGFLVIVRIHLDYIIIYDVDESYLYII